MSAVPKAPTARPLTPYRAARLRERMAEAIERLIAAMDALDPDPDIEEDDPGGGDIQDERHDGDLGWHGNVDQTDLVGDRGWNVDRELDPTDCIDRHVTSRSWTKPHCSKAEAEAEAIRTRVKGPRSLRPRRHFVMHGGVPIRGIAS